MNTANILVIDDNPIQVQVTKRVLAQEGYTVISADSGEEGLALAREHKPDLLLLDVIMPDMDGFEVWRRIKQIRNYRK